MTEQTTNLNLSNKLDFSNFFNNDAHGTAIILGYEHFDLEQVIKVKLKHNVKKVRIINNPFNYANEDEQSEEILRQYNLLSEKYNSEMEKFDITFDSIEEIIEISRFDTSINNFCEYNYIKDIVFITCFKVLERIEHNNIPSLFKAVYKSVDIKNFKGWEIIVPNIKNMINEKIPYIKDEDGLLMRMNGVIFNRDHQSYIKEEHLNKSIWSEEIMKYYINLEGLWEINSVYLQKNIDGNIWYDKYLLMPNKHILKNI